MSIAIAPSELKAAVAPAEHRAGAELDPFHLGWRYVTAKGADGSEYSKQMPLTEWDVLHPQEGDFIVTNYAHWRDCIYIGQSIETVLAGRKQAQVLVDHRVDWQEPGVLPHGPDVSAFDDLNKPWDIHLGTFKVHDMGATILLGVEVASLATWKNDVGIKIKEYFLARMPYYVIVDSQQATDENVEVAVIGYRATPEGFVPMASDPVRGIWIPTVGIGFKIIEDRVRCVDQSGTIIPDRAELEKHVQEMLAQIIETEELRKEADGRTAVEKQRAEIEKQRADFERQRAETEKQRAETEKQRADYAQARIQQLEAELKNARG